MAHLDLLRLMAVYEIKPSIRVKQPSVVRRRPLFQIPLEWARQEKGSLRKDRKIGLIARRSSQSATSAALPAARDIPGGDHSLLWID